MTETPDRRAPDESDDRALELRVFTEPQAGATYETLLTVAQHAEALGYGAFFRSDHFLTMGGDGLPGPTDAWVTLGGIARETARIRLGTLVTSATFRLPGPLAIAVAQVDAMSGGRVELGLGAGWFEAEHRAYGIPFPTTRERFDRLEEQLAVITGLWSTDVGSSFSHDGDHYRLQDSPALPKPVQHPRPPVIVGGVGATRTPRLAATYADEFNAPFVDAGFAAQQFQRVREACERADRDPATIRFSFAQTICCAADEPELARRAAAIGRDAATVRQSSVAGTPDEVIDRLAGYVAAGATRAYLQFLDLTDLDHLGLVAAEVMPALG